MSTSLLRFWPSQYRLLARLGGLSLFFEQFGNLILEFPQPTVRPQDTRAIQKQQSGQGFDSRGLFPQVPDLLISRHKNLRPIETLRRDGLSCLSGFPIEAYADDL